MADDDDGGRLHRGSRAAYISEHGLTRDLGR